MSMCWTISVDINLKYINFDILALAFFQHHLFLEIAETDSDQGKINTLIGQFGGIEVTFLQSVTILTSQFF